MEIDAADQLEKAQSSVTKLSLYPALSSLEMLHYPKSALVMANEVLARFSVIEVIPPEAPLTLLNWGLKRVLPVRLTQLTITEEAFDVALNLIRAKVSISLRVMTTDNLDLDNRASSIFLNHLRSREALADRTRTASLQSFGLNSLPQPALSATWTR